MRDNGLYEQILGVRAPWSVTDVKLDPKKQEVQVIVAVAAAGLKCPECGADCPGYDSRRRTWRHLDTCQYRTLLTADVPRVTCPTHGVLQIRLPWAEEGSHFTALFESLVIDWLREANASAVSRLLRLTWHEPDNMPPEKREGVFRELRTSDLKVARAWSLKETAIGLWNYLRRGWAEKGWTRWIAAAIRSRMDPMKKAAGTIRNHLWGILRPVATGCCC